VTLSNEVECDEAYVIAGHKGQPEVVKKRDVKVGAAVSKAQAGAVHWRKRDRLFSG
jgi:hypothetical protein